MEELEGVALDYLTGLGRLLGGLDTAEVAGMAVLLSAVVSLTRG